MEVIEQWGSVATRINFMQLVKETVKEFRKQITELNQQQLEKEGIDSKGIKLSPYSPSYKRVRARKGLPTNRKTLKFEGDFHAGFYALAFDRFWEQGSKDWKEQKLTKDYGIDIFGLTPESIDKLLWELGFVDRLREKYREALLRV